jgi:hypothetical protein
VQPDKIRTKKITNRAGVWAPENSPSETYSLKINRLLPSDRLRGRAGMLWSGSLQADHSFAGRQNL